MSKNNSRLDIGQILLVNPLYTSYKTIILDSRLTSVVLIFNRFIYIGI